MLEFAILEYFCHNIYQKERGKKVELTTRETNAYAKKHILNNYHLRRWTPIKYYDNSKETGLVDNQYGCIIGVLVSLEERVSKLSSKTFVLGKIKERITGQFVSVMFFNQPYAARLYGGLLNQWVYVSGKMKRDDRFGWSFQTVEVLEKFTRESFRIIPMYSKIRNISQKVFLTHLNAAFEEKEEETIPKWMRERYNLCGINEALKDVMLPHFPNDLKAGADRLLFDNLFYLASQFVLSERTTRTEGTSKVLKTDIMEKVEKSFPYELTPGQKNTVEKIVEKMKSGEPLHALVQGDVGCGKTITGFLPCIAVAENGTQACIVAPTEILAKQHYAELASMLEDTDLRVELFTQSTSKKKVIQDLQDGKIMIAVGTHALFSDKVQFKNLGLIVIDEEHKFGVEQRQRLAEKSEIVDVISMSATPIPRTLTKAIYGNNIDIYQITDMPGGRKKVITQYDNGDRRFACIDYILKQRQQVYVVCPAIGSEEEDDIDEVDEQQQSTVLSVEDAYKLYSSLFPNKTIAKLNGKMKPAETEEILSKFHAGDIDILIATTVVEVGVNVPNATLIVIENAERFGLAQMHQLRGRVGRGNLQSYCLLISDNMENKRIETLCHVSNGFEIARIDMEELRKSGDLFGEEQSGFNIYVEQMVKHQELYDSILEDSRTLTSKILKTHVQKMNMAEFQRRKPQMLVLERLEDPERPTLIG